MRHLDLELPAAEILRIESRALKWAFVARGIDVGTGVLSSHEVVNVIERGEGRRR